jgi:ketopantoate reductase
MSMLQDLERGRSLEIDALVTAVQELGQLTGVATPVIDAVLALVKERGRSAARAQFDRELERAGDVIQCLVLP